MIFLLKIMLAKKSARFFFVSLVFILYMLPQVYTETHHRFTFKPSAVRTLQNAQLVFLKKPLASLTRQAKVIALSETKGIQGWPLRNGEEMILRLEQLDLLGATLSPGFLDLEFFIFHNNRSA